MLSKLKKWWNRPKGLDKDLAKLSALIERGEITSPRDGLCFMLTSLESEVVCDIFASWPKYSGRTRFPVQHPEMPPNIAYTEESYKGNLYDTTTEYGRNRLELAEFIRQALLKEYY